MSEERLIENSITTRLHRIASMNKIPLSATFELTPRCNFNCKMCYVHMNEHQIQQTGKKIMSNQDWLELAKEAKDAGMLYLLLTGGEPFIYPNFRELLEELSNMGFVITINSNGYLINDEVVEWLKLSSPSRINITLYGASNETYEKLTGIKNGYDQVIANIKRLQESGISVKLSCSLTPYNVNDLDKMVKISQDNQLILQIVSYMFPAVRLSNENIGKNNRFTAEESAYNMLEAIRLQKGEKALVDYSSRLLAGSIPCELDECTEVTPDGTIRCRAGKSTFWVTWSGEVRPCGMMVEPSIQYKKGNFNILWKELVKQTSQIRLSGKCANCKNQRICNVCAAMAYAETGSFEKTPTYLCEMVNALRKQAKCHVDKFIKEREDTYE